MASLAAPTGVTLTPIDEFDIVGDSDDSGNNYNTESAARLTRTLTLSVFVCQI